ncbi:hypothetical protein B0E53_06162 [Micromonospora sp. MH33]|nr:hypothetical protein B0E53_06162 [Micromonospora sp. MH33]
MLRARTSSTRASVPRISSRVASGSARPGTIRGTGEASQTLRHRLFSSATAFASPGPAGCQFRRLATGSSPYGWRPIRSVGSGPSACTCSTKCARTAARSAGVATGSRWRSRPPKLAGQSSRRTSRPVGRSTAVAPPPRASPVGAPVRAGARRAAARASSGAAVSGTPRAAAARAAAASGMAAPAALSEVDTAVTVGVAAGVSVPVLLVGVSGARKASPSVAACASSSRASARAEPAGPVAASRPNTSSRSTCSGSPLAVSGTVTVNAMPAAFAAAKSTVQRIPASIGSASSAGSMVPVAVSGTGLGPTARSRVTGSEVPLNSVPPAVRPTAYHWVGSSRARAGSHQGPVRVSGSGNTPPTGSSTRAIQPARGAPKRRTRSLQAASSGVPVGPPGCPSPQYARPAAISSAVSPGSWSSTWIWSG